jgi:RNA polymerase sigma-70 factor (ECF subfamily)
MSPGRRLVSSASTPHRETESAIDERLASDDLEGAATLALRAYGRQIHGYLAGLTGDLDEAADVFSQFSEEFWRSLPGFRRESSLRTWAYRLAWRTLLRYRRDPFRRAVRLDSAALSFLVAEVCSSSTSTARRQARDRVARVRAELAPEERSLLILRIDRGLSWSDVARVMATDGHPVNEPALRKRFERLKEKVKKLARGEP